MKLSNNLIPIVLVSATLYGCQSGLYKVSTSEDGKKLDESVRYYDIGSGSDFIKDNGASPDGILYDEEQMPIKIIDGCSDMNPDEPGVSGLLWTFSLGVFPMFRSEYVTQDITVKSPIGEKSGSYRVDAKQWVGWLPIFIGYPGFADKRDDCAKLPHVGLEKIGRDRLVKNLVGAFSYKDYVAFAKSMNGARKAEIARIKSVSEKVSGLLAKNKFGDAKILIDSESKSRSTTQACDEKSWADMRERVVVARQAYEKNHVQALIVAGKYEDAITFCNSTNSLSDEVKGELKRKAETAHIRSVSEKVSGLLVKNQFDEASTLIENESKLWVDMRKRAILVHQTGVSEKEDRHHAGKTFDDIAALFNALTENESTPRSVMEIKKVTTPRLAIQEYDEKPWADMRERVVVARQAYEKNHVQALIAAGKYGDAISYCNSKNSLSDETNSELKREAKAARIISVFGEVSELLSKNKFDDAATLIDKESKSYLSTQASDEKSWADMRERVVVARQAYDRNHVQTLIAAGKYEDAISFCNSRNLISDEVVMKLKSLNLLSQLNKEQLVKIANTTERDDVALSVIGMIDDKIDLCSLLDKKRSIDVFKAILEKIADADLVRAEIWESRPKICDGGNEDELCVYVSVFGSDDECLKLIKEYPDLLTDAVLNELKHKVAKKETKSVIDEVLTKRLLAEISTLEMNEAIARVRVVDDEAIRSILLGKIAEKSITQHSLSKWNEHEISELKTAASIAAEVNNEDVTVAIVAKLLETIENYETRCRDSWSMHWGSEDETQVKKIVDCFAARMSVAVKEKILLKNKEGWKRIVSDICPESALKLLKMQQLKHVDLEVELANKINADEITVELYTSVRSEELKRVLFVRMSESVKKQVQAKAKEKAKKLFENANAASLKTFELKGFYLGMPIADAKELVSYYLPGSKIVITKNNDIEIDVTHTKELDVTPMFFCRADKEGKVYLFNFDKRFLKQWFNYDVQSYREWAIAYGKEFNVDFRAKSVKGRRSFDSVWISVTQELYQYRNNMKEYVISYFGEKEVFDPNDEFHFSSFNEHTARRMGIIAGMRAWVKSGWENGDGAKEGTLRVAILKED